MISRAVSALTPIASFSFAQRATASSYVRPQYHGGPPSGRPVHGTCPGRPSVTTDGM